MKKLTTLMAAGLALVAYNSASAQVGLHVNLNLGGVAVHAAYNSVPVDYSVYDNDDDYYYLPDAEAYYDVPRHCYYYNDGERWVSAAYLPGQFRNFDWRSARHYEIRGERPFMHHDMYRTRYGGFDNRGPAFGGNHFGAMNGVPDNRFNDRGFDRGRQGGFDYRGFDRGPQFDNRGGFDQRRNDNRDGQFQGGFDRQDRMNRDGQNGNYQNRGGFDQNQRGGQYPSGADNQGRGGQFQGGNQGQPQGGSMPQNGNGQNRGGGNRDGSQGQGGGQPQNGGGYQNGGQNRGGQPASDGQNRRSGGFQGDNHFTANQMGVIRPPRF